MSATSYRGRHEGANRPARILVVEDQELLATLIADVLGGAHEVVCARTLPRTRSSICSAALSISRCSIARCQTGRTGRSLLRPIGRTSPSC